MRKSRHLSSDRAPHDGTYARFVHTPVGQPTPREHAALPAAHEAVAKHRTLYRSRVIGAAALGRILISGTNNSKIGARCEVGAWAGMPIFYFSLEERRTCPVTCHVYDACYGNALPFATRVQYDKSFIMSLEAELEHMNDVYPDGFIVRPHILGDYPEIGYVRWWHQQLEKLPALRIWGYTAWPDNSEIGDAVWALNHVMAGRCAIRTSVPGDAPHELWQATTNWAPVSGRQVAGGILCPAEVPRAAGPVTCGRCGLCWKEGAAKVRIVFNGHGRRRRVALE